MLTLKMFLLVWLVFIIIHGEDNVTLKEILVLEAVMGCTDTLINTTLRSCSIKHVPLHIIGRTVKGKNN